MRSVYVTAPPKGMEWPYPLKEWVEVPDEVAEQMIAASQKALKSKQPSPFWIDDVRGLSIAPWIGPAPE